MRYLPLALFVSMVGFSTPAFSQICCPSGCVNDYNPPRCVFAGTTRTCASIACPGTSSGSTGGGGTGQTYVTPPWVPCTRAFETQSARDIATNACIAQLTATAQFWGCMFEDDAGRAEDQRTGLTCQARQAALANQCRARCAAWASSLVTCRSPTEDWQRVFGNIGGTSYGYARIDLCGPRLRTSVGNLIRPRPSNLQTQRSHP
jgi:hypothetical protein